MHSVLIAMKDAASARTLTSYFCSLPLAYDQLSITLLHVFRQPSASELLMGTEFAEATVKRIRSDLETAAERIRGCGVPRERIHIHVENRPYPTVAEGVIAHVARGGFDLVVIGRRTKSKSEEFVLGDASVKLVRALSDCAVLVVKT